METQLTIIMSNYNQEKYIKKAIDSILKQNVSFKYKIIITDDASTKDNSIKIIKEYKDKYPDIVQTIFNEVNGGYLTNILKAKEITKTPYFCLLDADDYYTDYNFLQRGYDYLEQHKDYVIYYENVNYLYEDNSTRPFIANNIESGTYTFNDYLTDKIPIVQTTGQFYRNIIFSNGIPSFIKQSVGTVSERSFEGDYGRFLLHLKYGKAYFYNNICGVYRILSSGIWQRLSIAKRNLIQMQFYYDYNIYYENKYSLFFARKMYDAFIVILNYYKSLNENTFTEKDIIQLQKLYNFIVLNNKELLQQIEIENKKQNSFTFLNFVKKFLKKVKHFIYK